MSYIRCLGNPEGLYIIATNTGQTEFVGEQLSLPRHVFEHLLLKWLDRGDNVRYRGASLTQTPKGTPLPKDGVTRTEFSHWTFRYKDWPEGKSVIAWEVTWQYIAQNVAWRYLPMRTRKTYLNALVQRKPVD